MHHAHSAVVAVSIPRSGFWVFKPQPQLVRSMEICCFNPSVGILGVQAGPQPRHHLRQQKVSIPRSGFWVFKLHQGLAMWWKSDVSIPRSGFWVFKLSVLGPSTCIGQVSIPRSGFWVFKQPPLLASSCGGIRFNPSVGILGVQARTRPLRRCRLT